MWTPPTSPTTPYCAPKWNRDFEPRLPLDLERLIFETAALAHPASIPALMRIAWRVKSWTEPHLYRLVSSTHPRTPTLPIAPLSSILASALSPSLPSLKSPAVLRGVHHLFLCAPSSSDVPQDPALDLAALLAALPALASLFLYVPPAPARAPSASVYTSLLRLRDDKDKDNALLPGLRSLVLQPRTLLTLPASHALLRSITHLELLELGAGVGGSGEAGAVAQRLLGSQSSDSSEGAGEVGMQSLTHLAVNSVEVLQALASTLSAQGGKSGCAPLSKLACVVLLCSEERREMIMTEVPECFLSPSSSSAECKDGESKENGGSTTNFVCIGQSQTDSYEDWARGAHTGETYWGIAERVVAGRRSGAISRE
ncbi:hypothetical protein C8R46DRAFT_1229550 [Mycena filopes]|nr:hypothetical protein C8R46DRAFT_1229550 [Mycena filopes]